MRGAGLAPLELLELLQARPVLTGREIADRLEIDPRTVRRYVEALPGGRSVVIRSGWRRVVVRLWWRPVVVRLRRPIARRRRHLRLSP